MHYAFPFLPTEVQTSIREISALGTIPDAALDLLIARTAKALEDKTTSLQMTVVKIEENINKRLELIGQKLQADLQTQHGATNAMLIDVRQAQQIAHPQIDAAMRGVTGLAKAVQDMDVWQGRLKEAFEAGRDFAADERARLEAKLDGALERIDVIEQVLDIPTAAGDAR